jgi:hypothetical protein
VLVLLDGKRSYERYVKGLSTKLCCATWTAKNVEELGVNGGVGLPLFRHIVFVINSFNWADWFAGATVHTFIRLDIEHPVTLIDAIHRAFFNASTVFEVDTR